MPEIQVQQLNSYSIMSMDVAQMVEKTHNMLLRDIRRYCKQLGESNIAQSDFFMESTYKNQQNKEQPCYLVTKQGCEFIAHKMTGVKGTAFTARYILRFHEMEEALKSEKENQNITLPLAKNTWFNRNKDLIEMVCEKYEWDKRYLYHRILNDIGSRYDMEGVKQIYEKKTGNPVKYSTQIFDYFKVLGAEAESYLDYLYKL